MHGHSEAAMHDEILLTGQTLPRRVSRDAVLSDPFAPFVDPGERLRAAKKYTPKKGEVVVVSAIPTCNFCSIPTPGPYDFKTRDGSWTNGCEAHYKAHRASPSLGVGQGQRLVTRDQVRENPKKASLPYSLYTKRGPRPWRMGAEDLRDLDLGSRPKVPNIDPYRRDLHDDRAPSSPEDILRNYHPGPGVFDVYLAWVPLVELPCPILVEEEQEGGDDDGDGYYDWTELQMGTRRGGIPAPKLFIDMKELPQEGVWERGEMSYLDGNHRMRFFFDNDYVAVLLWVVQRVPAASARRNPTQGVSSPFPPDFSTSYYPDFPPETWTREDVKNLLGHAIECDLHPPPFVVENVPDRGEIGIRVYGGLEGIWWANPYQGGYLVEGPG
jgi:hypothetical protein